MNTIRSSISELSPNSDFISRHIGLSEDQQQAMLATLGYDSLQAFINECIPKSILSNSALKLDPPVTENQALKEMAAMAEANQPVHYMLGCGYASSYLPAVLERNFIENPSWYTAYTPYQAEISQGRLQLLFNFQQMIVELTNLELSNASLLDEATAAAEALMIAYRAKPKDRGKVILIEKDCHPQTLAVIQTRCEPLGIEPRLYNSDDPLSQDADVFALLVHYPGNSGRLIDYRSLFTQAHEHGICTIVATDPMALVLLTPPGDIGADIAIGTSQRFGVPLGFGGPHAGFIACKQTYKRHMPGRIIGLSKDASGQPALRMALQTREQHIRREKATSNICTAQALLANLSVLYAQYHGADGLTRIALRIHRIAKIISAGCNKAGLNIRHNNYFDSIIVETGEDTQVRYQKALEAGYCLRKFTNSLQICCNETTSNQDALKLIEAITDKKYSLDELDSSINDHHLTVIPKSLLRCDAPLRSSIFTSLHTETEMMRYLKSLEDKDIGLNRSMIPLGSCTMKLNAATEMKPLTWQGFANVHPFAPTQLHAGYTRLIDSLEQQLCAITGFAKISMQPNSGSQGEFAGLIAIRKYHQNRGESNRNTCLIPSSAHGTNPASAQMAGMSLVIVACDARGNVRLDDLQDKAEQHSDNLAALMITYPSTHGVYEQTIRQVCEIIHINGGLVYMDGANTNAMVGMVKPAELGADVMHLNLHKTFCIPHGGGGPGAGPIGVCEKLVDFLPTHPTLSKAKQSPIDTPMTTISAAPWGSALILTISWAYIKMMGSEGLSKATCLALLNANYIVHKLKQYYPILYTGDNGLIAHECIIDIRPLKQTSGISEEDIAKRLIDYGFHAPTMSFPVAGTLMIEPTESESQSEIDRFCQAMIKIREEIDIVAQGTWPIEDNPLVNAPHTATQIASDDWQHPYSRQQACYPLDWIKNNKYWPPVTRVDNIHGDKNFCACLPIAT